MIAFDGLNLIHGHIAGKRYLSEILLRLIYIVRVRTHKNIHHVHLGTPIIRITDVECKTVLFKKLWQAVHSLTHSSTVP